MQMKNVIFSALALLFGAIIYICLRINEPVFFDWADRLGLGSWLEQLRIAGQNMQYKPPSWVIYSLPNGLWAFAYALIISTIWSGERSWLRLFWMATIPVIVWGFELLQILRAIPGTFCLIDLAFGTIGLLLGFALGVKATKTNHHETTFA